MLDVRGLTSGYGPLTILHGVDLSVGAGEIVAIVGANGAGKTTLLRTLSGLIRARAGTVMLDGVDVTGLATHSLAQAGLGHVPEGRKIFKPMDVLSNLEVGACARRQRDRVSIRQDLDRVFTLFPRLAERHTQIAGTLSGGEQQMLAVGRALMGRPRLLLLDEPSLGLAPMVFLEIFAAVRRICAEGVAIVLVEQNVRLALQNAKTACVLQSGRVVLNGPSAEVLGTDLVQQAYLGGTMIKAGQRA
jgi:branched-chain amino acid transport system ATP-binding protein